MVDVAPPVVGTIVMITASDCGWCLAARASSAWWPRLRRRRHRHAGGHTVSTLRTLPLRVGGCYIWKGSNSVVDYAYVVLVGKDIINEKGTGRETEGMAWEENYEL